MSQIPCCHSSVNVKLVERGSFVAQSALDPTSSCWKLARKIGPSSFRVFENRASVSDSIEPSAALPLLIHQINADVSPYSRSAWPGEIDLGEVNDFDSSSEGSPSQLTWPEERHLEDANEYYWDGDFTLIQNWVLDADDQSMEFSFAFETDDEVEGSFSFEFDLDFDLTPAPTSPAPTATPATSFPVPSEPLTPAPLSPEPPAPTPDGGGDWVPRVGDSWQYNLDPPVDTDVDADVFFIDTIGASGGSDLTAALVFEVFRLVCVLCGFAHR